MMSVSSFTIRALVSETNEQLAQATLDKVTQLGEELFKFSFKTREGKRDLLIEPGERFNLTSYKLVAPPKPSNFVMLLRKHISGKRLEKIEQHNFDRVITLDFGERRLIVELFANGNIVLTDAGGKILFAFRHEEWAARHVKRGEKYKFPPSKVNLLTLTEKQLDEMLGKEEIVRVPKSKNRKKKEKKPEPVKEPLASETETSDSEAEVEEVQEKVVEKPPPKKRGRKPKNQTINILESADN